MSSEKLAGPTVCMLTSPAVPTRAFPSFHPENYAQPMISDDPSCFQSHFIKVKASNRKGQARYRCVTCSHEFECTGKLRLIQHILGRYHSVGGQPRNVKACPRPHLPLKNALLLQYDGSSNGFHSPSQSGSPRFSTTQNILNHGEKNYRVLHTHSSDSFYSQTSSDSLDEDEDDDSLYEFLVSIGATEDSFLSDVEEESKISTEDFPPLKRIRSDDTVMDQANQCLVRFFSNYNVPISAASNPLFLELVNAIQYAGSLYRPTLSDLLQDSKTS